MIISSYSSIFSLGHKAIEDIFLDDVEITEKLDGSQISFAVTKDELCLRSKGSEIIVGAPEPLFQSGVTSVMNLKHKLTPSWIYRGEYISKPKHNVLKYDRIPLNHIALFNIDSGDQHYLTYEEMLQEASRLGLEVVPRLFYGKINTIEQIHTFLNQKSMLGGSMIEGCVIKNYNRYGFDKKILMAKLVNFAFKEVHGGEWRKNNPTTLDIISQLIAKYQTPARWDKAIIHLRERGELEDDPRDIGKLLKEIATDVLKEEESEIKDALFKYVWPKIQRGIIRGFPEYYKELLASKQFEK